MAGAPYESAKEARGYIGALSSVSAFNHKRAPMSFCSDSMPMKQIIGKQ